MTLRFPWMLLLLLVVPILVYLRHRRRQQKAILFSDRMVLENLPRSWAVHLSPLLPILYSAGLAFLIIALARPQKGLEETRVHSEAVDIVLLIDVSTSMRAEDFSTIRQRMDRLDAAKKVIKKFVDNREHDRIGMVAFAGLPYTVAPLTLDHVWLNRQMERIKTGMLEDGTAIGTAIASGINRLRDSEAKSKLIVLLTDGANNRGGLDPRNAAQAAKALGIKIYAVGAGTDGIVRIPVQDPFGRRQYVRRRAEFDEPTLRRIAEITGALYFRAKNFERLEAVYNEIDRMEKTEVDVEQFTRFEEGFAPFLLCSLLCLGLEKLLSLGRLGRLP